MAAHLTSADRARIARLGIGALSAETGLALLDAALASGRPSLVAAELRLAATSVPRDTPPLLRALTPTRARARQTATGWAEQLTALPETERAQRLLTLVRATVADIGLSDLVRSRLNAAASRLNGSREPHLGGATDTGEELEFASDDEMFDLIEKELGSS